MQVRNFILELLTIELLKDKKGESLTDQLEHVWTELRDNIDDITIEDPANPTGNDLTELFNSAIKLELSDAARVALQNVKNDDWKAIFGEVPAKKPTSASASWGSSGSPTLFTPRPTFGSDARK